jgi:DNA polymerase-3 subunit delta
VKAKSTQISALTTQLQQHTDAVVLFGLDEGELNHALTQLKQLLGLLGKGSSFLSISKEAFKKNSFIATDEANMPSLIAERRFLFIDEDIPFTVAALTHFLQHKHTDALLIIQGGNLNKTNALRIEAEKNPRVLAISCYTPSLADIQKSVLAYFQTHHKRISQTVLNELCQKVSFNQQVINQELEKLLLYLGDKEEVTLPDLAACLTTSSDTPLEDFCFDLADGKIENVQKFLHLYLSSGESEVALFRAVREYFERLLLILCDTSEPLPLVIKKNLRSHQFRFEIPLLRQARFWTVDSVLHLLDSVGSMERNSRQTGLPKEILIEYTFLQIAKSAKSLSGLR